MSICNILPAAESSPDMSLRDIFKRRSTERPLSRASCSAVVDTSNDTLIAIGTYAPALLFLNESMMDTLYVPYLIPSDTIEVIRKASLRSRPEWSLNAATRGFKVTNPSIISEDMRDRAVIAAKKVEAFTQLSYWINHFRMKIDTGLFFQTSVYAEKERQARTLKESGFNPDHSDDAPYVTQYADDIGISIQEAAEEILLQARLDHDYLAKTEKLRLSLFRNIKKAKTAQEVDEILGNFLKNRLI